MSANFETIDTLFAEAVMRKYGYQSESAKEFLMTLFRASREGNLCIPMKEKQEYAHIFEEEICVFENKCYLKRYWECEQNFLKHLKRILEGVVSKKIDEADVDGLLKKENISEEQKEAIRKALSSPLTLITGGPGCGKTFTARIALRIFSKLVGGKIALLAPTGKAAANLRSYMEGNSIAATIHSVLSTPLNDIDLFIVDESAMIDAELMLKLFAKVKTGSRVILLGDHNQLPPVESGKPFEMMLKEKECVSELTHCFRAELKEIVEMAECVKKGEMIPFQTLPERGALLDMLAEKVLSKQFRLLTATRVGHFGSDEINRAFYERHLKRKQRTLFIPIVITANDPSTELFNGDTGVLTQEDGEYKAASFENGKVLPFSELPSFEWAYATSIHKSQGSEYDEVMVILDPSSKRFGREILYTAITRARKKVTVYGMEEVIQEILQRCKR